MKTTTTPKSSKQVRKFFTSQKQQSKIAHGRFWANTNSIGVSTNKSVKVSANVSVALLSIYCVPLNCVR